MEKKYRLAGADYVLLPSKVTSMMLLAAITKPVLFKGLYALLTGRHAAHIDEVYAYKTRGLIGKRVNEIDFKRYRLLLIGIQRGEHGEFIFNPSSDTTIVEEDILLLMGLELRIRHFKEDYMGDKIE
jgi:voltage-gated potassium channel